MSDEIVAEKDDPKDDPKDGEKNQAAKGQPQPLDAEDVLDWLRQNRDFFLKHPDILDELTPPRRALTGAGVVDFQQAMVEKARKDKSAVMDLQRELIENSRSNMSVTGRVHAAILSLLDAQSFEEFIQTITMDLSVILDVDVVSLLVEATDDDVAYIHRSGVRVLLPGKAETILGGHDALLAGDIEGDERVFGPGAGLVRSQALMRIEISDAAPVGVLAFGSRDPQMFQEGQATELIGFLTRVVERQIRIWLDLPA